MEDTGERKSGKDSGTSISNNKNSQKDISHEVEPTNTSSSQENIENNDIERGKDVTLQNQEISPEKNFTPSSTEKHISHNTRADKSKISGNKKSMIILDDSMTELLNGWEMAKKIQSNFKIYYYYYFFLSGFSSQTLTIHRTAGEGRGPSFIPLYHFHPLRNIETFICNFACEMTITYF